MLRFNKKRQSFYAVISSCFLLLVTSVSTRAADPVDRHSLTVAYIYNFAKNVEWSNQSLNQTFNIGIYGDAPVALRTAFSTLEKNNQLQGRKIQVRYVDSLSQVKSLHLLYIIQQDLSLLGRFYQEADGRSVLLVTQDFADQSSVMINLLTQGNKIRFEVNKSNIINQGLLPLPELILNGGTEIDVAELYRQGQNSLVKLQKNLNQREKTLQLLETRIAEQEVFNTSLQRDLQKLNQDIAISAEEVKRQNQVISEQYAELAKVDQEKALLLEDIRERTRELDEQKRLLTSVMTQIQQGENRVRELDDIIKNQETRLVEQDQAIVSLDQTVSEQRKILVYSWSLAFLGFLLVVTIGFAYSIKRRDNRRLAERAEDLQFAKDRLLIAKRKADEASQAKSEFLSLMSHELRTPLQSIIGYTEVVLEELSQSSDQRHLGDLNRVITNSERLLKLINNVLDLAKAEAGQITLDLTHIKLSELVEDAVSNIKPLIDKKGLSLQLDVYDGEYLPVADPEKILQIMINLMGNAVKFTTTGGIHLRAHHLKDAIEISIRDTGPGISSDQLDKIFEAFHQSEQPRHKKIEGTGLGLAITKQFVELMSGRVNVKSELGKGSEFVIRIPLPIETEKNRTLDD